MTVVERALDLVAGSTLIGLGSGRAAQSFIRALGERVRSGAATVHGIPTSEESADLAGKVGIPLTTLAEVDTLDVTVDGADEVDPGLNMIKGYGRAMVREKIVAAASRRLLILVGEEKLVPQLGTRRRLPVEVLPFALPTCKRKLHELGCHPTVWTLNGLPLTSDNGNNILDCAIGPIEDAHQLESTLLGIPGVVGTGLFLGMASVVLVGKGPDFQLIDERSRA